MKVIEQFKNTPKIESLKRLDKKTFINANKAKTPLVLTEAMKNWEAYSKWNLAYLSTHYGEQKILANRLSEKGERQHIYLNLEEYINYAYTTDDPNPYYGISYMHVSNSLKEEYEEPEYFHCWYKQFNSKDSKIDLSCLYLAPKNGYSPMHQDIWGTSFWNALFEGKKIWLFYSEDQTEYLYGGSVNPFYPDLEKYPLFSQAKATMWLQEPGELIFCPGNVWHTVLALEPCLALSENFINETDYQNVLHHFEKHNHPRAYSKMKKIASIHQYD